MKKSDQVRRPELANSTITTDKTSNLSIGDTLRLAKRNLMISRCLTIVLVVLLIALLVIMIRYGGLLDMFFNFVSDSV
ncbi:MAG: hypothetical protein K5745_03420 [Saccharofermentans sp.]|nr:hypothetical protein [Saccharofermentans sp.]